MRSPRDSASFVKSLYHYLTLLSFERYLSDGFVLTTFSSQIVYFFRLNILIYGYYYLNAIVSEFDAELTDLMIR